MKGKFVFLVPLLILLCCSFVAAQTTTKDGEFDTRSWTFWSKTGGHYGGTFANFNVSGSGASWCYMKKPNTVNGNGSILQDVNLIADVTYEFKAAIATYKPC